ncbi:valine--tRNA ligase [Cytophagaceae bacterium ABcell3]|nr:valine--tRNA ligase [Cytophagaceae bacterium ABcell3]
MALPEKKYNPKEAEKKWYGYWNEKGFFRSKPNPDKEPYTIVIPPPNVTGVLHMGHMLNNTIQDVLIRKARMEGKEACWVPGTDHASIATEAKVVAMLREKGIKKSDLSRDDFLKHAWEWKEKYGGIILDQLKKLGASCDWERTRFTMEPAMSDSVIKVFIDLYKKGFIYKGVRMVNWDPQGKTALSDEEVIHKEVNSKLYYLKYKVEGEDDFITIATTRPETILGDTAVCVNPNDDRYKKLQGKKVIVPLINRSIPVIFDEYVDVEFGTGCLKVTPCHDVNDYNLGQKHNLEFVDILNEDGTLSEKARLYVGMDRFVVRKQISKDLQEAGILDKVEDIRNNVGYSERTDAVIEPRLSAQWFVNMKKFMEANPEVLDAVMSDEITLYPSKFKNTYRHWIENIKDWCISRQLWWGHRIPAWYMSDGSYVVAETVEEAVALFKSEGKAVKPEELRQDEDVLDTWFSSWLWPITVFDGLNKPDNEDIKYYYPTDTLVTAPEILFFWVARMIMAGYEYKKAKPFKNVYLTGIVRDAQGRKMSKSLGNSPDPLDLIDQYGADGVRVGMLLSSPAGNDLLFDIKLCEQGWNFSNKIWNAYRLISGWEVDESLDGANQHAIEWINARVDQVILEIEEHYGKFRLSDALMSTYKLVWDDFCSWYLEMVKPDFEKPIDGHTYRATLQTFEKLLKLLHPFMPFITEELWHEIKEREANECIVVAEWPKAQEINTVFLQEMDKVLEVVANIRNIRNSRQIARNFELELHYKSPNGNWLDKYGKIISKLAVVSEVNAVDAGPEGAAGFVIKSDEFFVPIAGGVDPEKERERITKDLEYTKGFLASVSKKLSNEKFVNGAPKQVVENEMKKKADAEAKIKALEESLSQLAG